MANVFEISTPNRAKWGDNITLQPFMAPFTSHCGLWVCYKTIYPIKNWTRCDSGLGFVWGNRKQWEGLTSWVELLGIISEKYCAAMINVRLLQCPCNYCRVTNDPDVTIRRFEAEQRKKPNLSSLSFAISDTGFIPVDQFAESISAIISTINYKSQMQSESRQ